MIKNYDKGIHNEYKDLNINLDGMVQISDVNTGIYTTYSGTNVNIKSIDENKVVNSLYIKAAQYGLDATNASNIDITAARTQIVSADYGIRTKSTSTAGVLYGFNHNDVCSTN